MNQKLEEKNSRIQEQASEIAELQRNVAELKKLVQALGSPEMRIKRKLEWGSVSFKDAATQTSPLVYTFNHAHFILDMMTRPLCLRQAGHGARSTAIMAASTSRCGGRLP